MYTKKDLGFILYNNRSVNGVVKNFLPRLNPYKLIEIENQLDIAKSSFENEKKMVEINIKELDIEAEDIIVTPEDIYALTDLVKQNIGNFNTEEYEYLAGRGFGDKTILSWNLLGLSSITDNNHLSILGATRHPILSKIFDDGIKNGGIIIPLFEDEKLVNCAIRKINSSKSLKYSLACPDIPVWGLDHIDYGDEIWITEGIFDMISIYKQEKKAVSCSSAMWTGIQLYKVLEKKPKNIVIFSDMDEVGLRTSAILKSFFISQGISSKILISIVAKDPAEHYFQKLQSLDTLQEIDVTEEMIKKHGDESFNFIDYLKKRKF